MRLGYIVGSLSSTSINRKVANALVAFAPEGVELVELDYTELPVYSPDADSDYPQAALDWKSSIEGVDGIIIVTPEYLRSVPGALKNAIDWASRPWGTNSFNGKPVAIAGASIGSIGTAAAQQHLRAVLGHLNAPTLGQPEVFLQYRADAWDAEGALIDEQTAAMLQGFLAAAIAHVERYAAVTA
ncbi:NAD(P)H-dependent oxidoreductase [Demequina sp. TTPB684]|uniref:NADPH-dependent FMN reductase n=1 Tax=unclassified Demequina TaxID=2620311 RepID=UPI001CF5AA69|nr:MULTISPECIES: NADPH-dependent FMN reductase [unclassified Demequina]MCB2413447.1 NAD(P)H-dependent oxidoreductase [Demequina sp. TTPB684]UPU88752.1 NAD(P)H-dependent oxidoreductase [Demequina sp. TMPB413]